MDIKRLIGVTILLVLVMVSSAFSADAYTSVASFFADYDKGLEGIANKASKVSSLKSTEKMFKSAISSYDCMSYIFRTNSKGKIIAKVTPSGVQPRNFRYIGKQKWYKIIAMSNKPYYGYTKSKSSYYLFWNKPIHVTNNGRFGGSISAKIDLTKSLKSVAEDEGLTFKIKLGSKTLFSNLEKISSETKERPLFIGGLPVLTMYYETSNDGSTPLSTVEDSKTSVEGTKDVVDSSKVLDKKIDSTKDIKKSAVKDKRKDADLDKKSGLVPFFITLIILFIIGAIGALVISAKYREKKLFDDINNEDI